VSQPTAVSWAGGGPDTSVEVGNESELAQSGDLLKQLSAFGIAILAHKKMFVAVAPFDPSSLVSHTVRYDDENLGEGEKPFCVNRLLHAFRVSVYRRKRIEVKPSPNTVCVSLVVLHLFASSSNVSAQPAARLPIRTQPCHKTQLATPSCRRR
jgi:hypothetical protein